MYTCQIFHSYKVINPVSLSPISYLLLLVEPKRVAVEEQGTWRGGGGSIWVLNARLFLFVRTWSQSGVRSRQLWKTLDGRSPVLAMVATWAPYAGRQWCLGLSAGLWRKFLGSVEKDFQLAPKKFWQKGLAVYKGNLIVIRTADPEWGCSGTPAPN